MTTEIAGVKVTGESDVGQSIEKDLTKALHSLEQLKEQGTAAANKFAASMDYTSKQGAAFGRSVGLTKGEVDKLVKSGGIATHTVRELGQAEMDTASKTRGLKESADSAASSLSSMAGGMQAAVAALAVDQIIDAGSELLQIGISAKQSKLALGEFSGGQVNTYLDTVSAATRNTVSEMDAATISSTLLGMGITKTADQTAEMIRVSSILGSTFKGMGAADAANEFAILIANMSYQRLDQFGISSGAVRARVRELKEETPGLTTEMAFFQATMELATTTADRLQGSMSDTALTVQQTQAAMADLKVASAELVTEGMEPTVTGLAAIVVGFNDYRKASNDFRAAAAVNSDSLEEYAQTLTDAGLMSEYFNRTIRDGSAIYSSGPQLEALTEQYQELRQAAEDSAQASYEHAIAQRGANYAAQALAESEAQAAAEATALEEAEKAAAQAQREAERASRDHAAALRDQHREHQAIVGIAHDAATAIAEMGAEQYLAGAESGATFLNFLKATGNELLLTGNALTEYMVKKGMLTESDAAFISGQQQVADFLTNYPGLIDEAAIAFDAFATRQTELGEQILSTAESQALIAQGYSGWEVAAIQASDSAEDAQLGVEEGAARLNEAVQAITANAPLAMEAIAVNAPIAEEGINPLHNKFRAINGFLAALPELAQAAMLGMAQAMQAQWETVGTTAGMVDGMADSWRYLHANPNLHLTADINGGAGAPAMPSGGGGGNAPHALGGPASASKPILVGEQGREIFVPNEAGQIVPNNLTERMMSGETGGSTHATIRVPVILDGRQIAEVTARHTIKANRRRGVE